MITTLNEEIANLNNQLSKEKSTVSSLQEEKKKLKSDFKTREDELLDKQIQLDNKIKELDNILIKMGQSIQTMHMLSPKPDSFYHTEQKMALVDARLKNFKIQFLKEAAKFVRDFKSLEKEAGESLAKHKALEFEIERLLRAVVSDQKDTTKGMSANTKFVNQSTSGTKLYSVTPFLNSKVIPKVVKMNDLSKHVTSNSVPTNTESKVMTNDKVIAPGIFRINSFNTSREDKFVPINQTRASIRTKLITVSETHVITKKGVNSNSNDLSSTRNDKSEVVCAMCKQCLITANHDVCVLTYVTDMNSCGDKYSANVSKTANKRKHKLTGKKAKKVGSKERLGLPKPRKLITCLRTRRIFDLKGKIFTSSESECQSDNSQGSSNMFMFLGTVHFGHDHISAIMGYGDLQRGNILITTVYFVNGLGHNLFSVGQFCDSDLEEMASASPICLMAHATSTKKKKKASHPPKPVANSKQRLHLLHMDLCGTIRVKSINGKRYVLMIVDDYSHYNWVHFLRSKDEAPEEIKTFLKKITILLQAPVIIVIIDNGTKFKNQFLKQYFDSVGISHQASSIR
ncbi:retrovirus-related pol polyprotein from transposon TNT 1-94 [Tanacetum coccineum]